MLNSGAFSVFHPYNCYVTGGKKTQTPQKGYLEIH